MSAPERIIEKIVIKKNLNNIEDKNIPITRPQDEDNNLQYEAEKAIESKMNLQDEIKNINEYFTDNRRGSRKSYEISMPAKIEKLKKIRQRRTEFTKNDSLKQSSSFQNVIEISIPKFKEIDKKTFYEIIIITNLNIFKSCHMRIWRRYSQFNELRRRVKKILGNALEFPKKNGRFLV